MHAFMLFNPDFSYTIQDPNTGNGPAYISVGTSHID